ncbi:ceramide glucosyltransferase-like isoform X1 [Haliotis asinina]|uniref:ceramide glucosyltransferase-like isoform X1 n=2 Tax=Haliotis asinina TaxID=109174 RepID=UPI003531CFCB
MLMSSQCVQATACTFLDLCTWCMREQAASGASERSSISNLLLHHLPQHCMKMYEVLDAQTCSYIVFILGILGLVFYCSIMFFVIISFIGGRFYWYRKSDPSVLGDDLPGVSIIKPLMGVDPLLEENLESHFCMKYPKFELLCCVNDEKDPAVDLVNRLCENYPKVDCKLFKGGKNGIINPMVRNMAPAYDAAQYEYVWISTSRIKASTDIIMDMVCKLQKPNVGLVHQMPFTLDHRGFGSCIEKIYFGCALQRFYLAFNLMNLCCVTGMSYTFKKSILDQLNGLSWFGKYLAEDYFLTKAIHEKGYKLVLSSFPAQQNVGGTSYCGLVDRLIRWMRLRINMLTVVSIMEPMADVFPLGAYGAWCQYHFFGFNPYYFFAAHVFGMLVMDYLLLHNAQVGPVAFSKLEYIFGWFIREFTSTFIFLAAIMKPHTIKWGRRTYRVRCGGHTEISDDRSTSVVL